MGFLYHQGIHVEKDIKLAMDYYQKSIEFDCVEALTQIGIMHEMGEGYEKDPVRAIEIFQEVIADDNREDDPVALFHLGRFLFRGEFIDRDYDLAKEFFEKARDLGVFHLQSLVSLL